MIFKLYCNKDVLKGRGYFTEKLRSDTVLIWEVGRWEENGILGKGSKGTNADRYKVTPSVRGTQNSFVLSIK